MKCYHCGEEISEKEIYNCNECGQNYCHLHANPVIHECNIVKESISQSFLQQNPPTHIDTSQTSSFLTEQTIDPQTAIRGSDDSVLRGTTDGSFTWYRQERLIPENAFDPDSGIKFKGILFPHKSEIIHFLIGTLLIFLIGLISFYNSQLIELNLGWAIFMLAGFYTTAFLFHELGHRQTAKHFGLQTKFRLLTFGMVLTTIGLIIGLLSLISNSPLIPTIALPGAVVVLGLDKIDRKTGWCKTAGPLVNLVYGTILLIISFFIPRNLYPLNLFIGLSASLNFTLGLFNMIPIGILDGQNIWKWNKPLYLFLVASLLILLILTFSNIYAPIETSLYVPEAWQAIG